MAEETRGVFDFFRKSARSLNRSVQEAKEAYVTLVHQKPETITQVEKTVKALSYALEFIPRDYDNSIFLTEILNSANSLFTYVNDCILKSSTRFQINQRNSIHLVVLLKRWLTVVECTQAFIEMSASRLGGRGARWAAIVVISCVKAIIRLVLLYWFKSGIQMHPAVKPLIREAMFPKEQQLGAMAEAKETKPFFYVGRRTGHVMRTLDQAPPMHSRTWRVPDPDSVAFQPDSSATDSSQDVPSGLTQLEQAGETLHIVRPLIHLISVGFFGTRSFVPWLASLITDASSHTLLSGQVQHSLKHSRFNNSERQELQRRALVMVFYLLRSPVYDRFTKTRLLKLIQVLSDYVPLVRFLLQPLARYLPVWQQVYFYAWRE